MTNLLFTLYNNYANRRYYKSTVLQDYDHVGSYTQENVNFCHGDGIAVTFVANIPEDTRTDYCVEHDNQNNILTRWFVIERQQLRMGQSRLVLKRDVLADYSVDVFAAKMFVERGFVPKTNPLIYNSEPLSVNQIKQSETLLKDRSNSAWYVAYLADNYFDESKDDTITLPAATDYSETYATTEALLAAYPGSTLDTPVEKPYNFADASFRFSANDAALEVFDWTITTQTSSYKLVGGNAVSLTTPSVSAAKTYFDAHLPTSEQFNTAFGAVSYDTLAKANGMAVKIGDGSTAKYYKLSVIQSSNENWAPLSTDTPAVAKTWISDWLQSAITAGVMTGTPDNIYVVKAFKQNLTATWYDITQSLTGTLKASVPRANNAPYYVLTWPQSDVYFRDTSTTSVKSEGQYSVLLAQTLFAERGSKVYDIQLLPYFAVPGILEQSGRVNVSKGNPNSVVNFGGKLVAYFVSEPSFTFVLNKEAYKIDDPDDIKLENITTMARLNSPNYAGMFEFSPAKNRGVTGYNVDCSYKPYTPYIHINPVWGGLYGNNFGDARGLICGGDFSIPRTTSQWTEYELNNKNYQLMFDRQIDTMDFMAQRQQIQEIFGAAAGTVSAATNGALAGGIIGGPTGAIAGGVIGGVASAAGGVADVVMNSQIRARQKEDSQLNFEYTLGNIKARPNTLTKVGAFNQNNKIFPFVEFYSCTDTEKTIVSNYLSAQSYSINAIGKLADYINPNAIETFVRAHTVYCPIADDSHVLDEINAELGRGIYFNTGGTT